MYLNRKDKIEAYLEGRLSKEEKQQFENALKADASLKDALNEQVKFINAIREMEFREMLNDIQQEEQKASISKKRNMLWIGIAASLLVLISSYWIFLYLPDKDLNSTLANIELDPGLPTALGITFSPEFGEGMNAYKQGDYQSAASYWKPLLAANSRNDTLLFYLSQVDLATNNNAAALSKLNLLQGLNTNTFSLQTDWYLALAKLRLGDVRGAESLLNEIVEKRGIWARKAEGLLKLL